MVIGKQYKTKSTKGNPNVRIGPSGIQYVPTKRKQELVQRSIIKRKYQKVLKQESRDGILATQQPHESTSQEHQQPEQHSADQHQEPHTNKKQPAQHDKTQPKRFQKADPFKKARIEFEKLQEEKRLQQEQKEKEIQDALQKKQDSKKKRADRSKLQHKRTQKGQPLMKHRIDAIVQKLSSDK